jgi:hypothetical protein
MEGRESDLPDEPEPTDFCHGDEAPVLFGHYWLDGEPQNPEPRAASLRTVRIAITAEAFEATARPLALGTVACDTQPNENGERLIWIEDPAGAIRRPSSGWRRCGKDIGRTSDAQQV